MQRFEYEETFATAISNDIPPPNFSHNATQDRTSTYALTMVMEGPGVPPSVSHIASSSTVFDSHHIPAHINKIGADIDSPALNDIQADMDDPNAEADDGKVYCICNGVSYGEMIACDDPTCEREWVRVLRVFCTRVWISDSYGFSST